MTDLLRRSATELAAAIRRRDVTSREVVDAHIARVEQVNPRINAVVAHRFDDARREALDADRRVRDADPETLPPFHGVPCTIKESFLLSGMPNTAGLVWRKHLRSERDAPTVARMRGAGMIPLGVTNTSELNMWMESDNYVWGRSNNPYDARRIVGGSSGGEGAIVGAGGSPVGLGADIGGSIRMPAFFNGVFGHKPSAGLVPNTGQYPVSENEARRLLSTGPIARRAEDLGPMLRLLAGPDGEDGACEPMTLRDPSSVDVRGLRVLDVEDDAGRTPVAADLHAAQRRAADHLARLGCDVRPTRIEAFRDAIEIWGAIMGEAAEKSYAEMLGEGRPVSVALELARHVARRPRYTIPSLGLVALERLEKLLPARAAKMIERGHELRAELQRLLGDDGVMLYPPYASSAPRHGAPLLPPTRWVYTALLNAMHLPVTQTPLGLDPRGLPLGVQVAAAHGNDHLTIAVARELERAFGGWVWPERAL